MQSSIFDKRHKSIQSEKPLLFLCRTEITQSKPSAAILVIEDLQPGTQYSCQGGMLVKVGAQD